MNARALLQAIARLSGAIPEAPEAPPASAPDPPPLHPEETPEHGSLTGVFSTPPELAAEPTGERDGVDGAIARRLRWEQRRDVNNAARGVLWVALAAHLGITFGDLQAFGGRLAGWEPLSFTLLLAAIGLALVRLRHVVTIGEVVRWLVVLGLGFELRVLALSGLCVDGPGLYLGISTILVGFCVTWVDAPGRWPTITIGAVYTLGMADALIDPRISGHLVAYLGVALAFNLGITRHLRHRRRRIARLTHQLGQQAFIDPLTGLHGRRYLYDAGRRWLARARQKGEPVSALYLDLDHLKLVNDRWGHDTGDEVLVATAEAIRALADDHLSARQGGEEFVVLLRRLPPPQVEALAEALRAAIRERTQPQVTASVGVAFAAPSEGLESLLQRADIALYAAKQAGRDQVVRARPPARPRPR